MLLPFLSIGIAQECPPPDSTTIQARECHFGSTAAYNRASEFLYSLTGCPLCNESVTKCQCVGCNTSGIIKTLLERSYRQTNGSTWYQPEVCSVPLLTALMCYQGNALPAESRLMDAMRPLYQLCAIRNGQSTGGQCDSILCHDCPVQPACEQTSDTSAEVRWFMSFYVVTSLFLWQAASELDVKALFSKRNDAPPPAYTKIPQSEEESSVKVSSFFDAM